MIEQLRNEHENVVLVDAGDMFFKTKTLPELRAQYILNGMSRMRYDAVTLGEGELNMPFDFLLDELDKSGMPFVSSNIRIISENKKEKLLLPYVIKDINGMRIAVTAVTPSVMMDDSIRDNKQVKIGQPISSLTKTITELKVKSDFIILLSHFGMGGTENLLRYNDFSDISLAVVGHGRLITQKAKTSGNTLVVQNSMGGEYLAVLSLNLDDTGKIEKYTLDNIALTDECPEDEYLKAEEKKFKSLKSKDEAEKDKIANQKKKEERKQILQLSPEAFLERMNNSENKVSD